MQQISFKNITRKKFRNSIDIATNEWYYGNKLKVEHVYEISCKKRKVSIKVLEGKK